MIKITAKFQELTALKVSELMTSKNLSSSAEVLAHAVSVLYIIEKEKKKRASLILEYPSGDRKKLHTD